MKNKLKDINSEIQIIESKSKSLTHHNEDLQKYKYDPNCEFCVQNGEEQINEQQSIQSQLMDLDIELKSLLEKRNLTYAKFEMVKDAEIKKDECDRFSDELNRIQNDAIKVSGKIESFKSKIKQITAELLNIDNKISQYYDNENKIKNNKKINVEILDVEIRNK